MEILNNLTQFSVTDGLPGNFYGTNLEDTIASFSSRTVIGSTIFLLFLVLLALILTRRIPILKRPVFILMTLVISVSTLLLVGATLYLNINSDSNGPVDWRADIEIWACGNELELRDPNLTFFNKIGSSTLHEHNDKSIYVEGTVVDKSIDASVGKFFYLVGGEITPNLLKVPLNPINQNLFENNTDGDGQSDPYAGLIDQFVQIAPDGTRQATFNNGQKCNDQESFVQMFVYHYNNSTETYRQEKIAEPNNYSISAYNRIPPGDCIIVEFGPLKDQTDKLCSSYGLNDIDRCSQFGIAPENQALCQIKQIEYPKIDPNIRKISPSTLPPDDKDLRPLEELNGGENQ